MQGKAVMKEDGNQKAVSPKITAQKYPFIPFLIAL